MTYLHACAVGLCIAHLKLKSKKQDKTNIIAPHMYLQSNSAVFFKYQNENCCLVKMNEQIE